MFFNKIISLEKFQISETTAENTPSTKTVQINFGFGSGNTESAKTIRKPEQTRRKCVNSQRKRQKETEKQRQ